MIENLPITNLTESPTNPRRRFGDLTELTDSIRKVGILQPLLARPINGGHELVFGHRRLRAAAAAGLEDVPVMVKEMTDKEVLETQLIENCQRVDIHPLEEAEGYQKLHQEHEYSVDDLANKVGKSKAYVYGRMKLCALSKRARKAFLEDKLNHSVALLVARIPVPKLQDEAIKEITTATWRGPMSVRQASEYVQRDFMLRLSDAPFKTGDAELLPKAGPCTTCPKRTGAQPELFDDVKSADVCTDPTCFAKKRDADWEHRTKAAEAKGQRVLDDKETKKLFPYGESLQSSQYVDLSAECYDDHKYRKWKTLLGKQAPTVALVRDARGNTHQLVDKKKAVEVVKERHPDIAKKLQRGGSAMGETSQEQSAKLRLKQKTHRLTVETTTAELVEKVEAGGVAPELWRLVLDGLTSAIGTDAVRAVMARRDIELPKGGYAPDVFRKALKSIPDEQLEGIVVELGIIRQELFHGGQMGAGSLLKKACKLYGIKWASHAAKARAAVKPKKKAKAKKTTARRTKAPPADAR